MKITLRRETFTENSTIGSLLIDGVFFCYTLEDKDRKLESGGKKIQNKTAIPRGTYEVIVNFSNRFKTQMPLLLNVPNYAGVRIHTGNTADHTEGCILLGETKAKDFIGMSRSAYSKFMARLRAVVKNQKVFIEIK